MGTLKLLRILVLCALFSAPLNAKDETHLHKNHNSLSSLKKHFKNLRNAFQSIDSQMNDNCFERSHFVYLFLSRLKIKSKKVWAIPLGSSSVGVHRIQKNWAFHVANLVKINGKRYVIDLAFNRMQKLDEWSSKVSFNSPPSISFETNLIDLDLNPDLYLDHSHVAIFFSNRNFDIYQKDSYYQSDETHSQFRLLPVDSTYNQDIWLLDYIKKYSSVSVFFEELSSHYTEQLLNPIEDRLLGNITTFKRKPAPKKIGFIESFLARLRS